MTDIVNCEIRSPYERYILSILSVCRTQTFKAFRILKGAVGNTTVLFCYKLKRIVVRKHERPLALAKPLTANGKLEDNVSSKKMGKFGVTVRDFWTALQGFASNVTFNDNITKTQVSYVSMKFVQ